MSYIGSAHEELIAEWNELKSAWQDSRSVWKDDVASQFERRFMSPFHTEIPVFLSRLEALKEELKTARRELR